MLEIDRESYVRSSPHEFREIQHPLYNNLKLYSDLGDLERLVYFIRDVQSSCFPKDETPRRVGMDQYTKEAFGGFLAKQLSAVDDNFSVWVSLTEDEVKVPEGILLAVTMDERWTLHPNFTSLPWRQKPTWFIHVNLIFWVPFQFVFYRNIVLENHFEMVFDYDNLLHLVMIVKNAGKGFSHILRQNIPHIDYWTILDTGSTDDTVKIIRDELATKVRGELFEEPFIDFGTSRNRALDLAGNRCKFAIMLDDTYYIKGDLRGFLNEIRSDQFADSFSLYVNSFDVQYVSNRLLKTQRNLRYIFKIHEVIQDNDNVNVIVPPDRAQIHDEQSDYMQKRTSSRKELDMRLLRQSIQEDPDNPRHWYYVAQTYVGMGDYENAYRFFLARLYHPKDGFLQEKIDACFEAARIGQFQLQRPWEEVKPLYEKAYALDRTRPDAVYFLAIKEYIDGNRKDAFTLFKKAFQIGYPVHAQYSLKPTLSFEFTPRFLTDLCYECKDFQTGKSASDLYLSKNKWDPVIASWNSIFSQLIRLPPPCQRPRTPEKPILCIIADGNWTPWTGLDLAKKGLGGSETYVVEMARWIQRFGRFQVYVFCRSTSPGEDVRMEGVCFRDLQYLYAFLREFEIHSVLISRFSEYIPLTLECTNIDNVFVVVHDLSLSGLHVPLSPPKLRQIFTLTEWHKEYFAQAFPTLQSYTSSMHYGISYPRPLPSLPATITLSRFIYSSFPNRGLLPLLQMWPRIRGLIPDATLDVFVDLQHKWTRETYPDMMREIDVCLAQLQNTGIQVHGWVSKSELYSYWNRAHVWLYPCIFQETFCLTALEAAISGTLAIASNLGALRDTISDRGILIDGDPMTKTWQDNAIGVLEECLAKPENVRACIRRNREWAEVHTWENQARLFQGWLDRFPFQWKDRYERLPLSQHPNPETFLFVHLGTGYSIYTELVAIGREKEIKEIYVLSLDRQLESITKYNLEQGHVGHLVTWINEYEEIPRGKQFDVVAVTPLESKWETYEHYLRASSFVRADGKFVSSDNEAFRAFLEQQKNRRASDIGSNS